MTAVKTIRVCNADWLDYLLNDESFDLKLIQLVRDPRAVARSRRSIHKIEVLSDAELVADVTEMCQNQVSRPFVGKFTNFKHIVFYNCRIQN